MSMLLCGLNCPGDSDQQLNSIGQSIDIGSPQKNGDILFWKGHVASVVNEGQILHANAYHMTTVIEKTIRSAVSNILNQNEENNIDQKSLKLKEIYVDGGPVMKRFRAASMGRASRLRRPTSHLTVVVRTKKERI